MKPERFQLTIGRILAATAWAAVDIALFDRLRGYRGPPMLAILPTTLFVGIFAITCAIPGALIGQTLKWSGIGLLVGVATLGAMGLLKLILVHFVKGPWNVPMPAVYLLCVTVGTIFVLGSRAIWQSFRTRFGGARVNDLPDS